MTLSVRVPAIDQPHELLSILAHELRSPVASVVGVLDLIADPAVGLEPSEVEELVSGARADAHHLLATLENLLSSARIATGTITPQRKKVQLARVVEEVLSGSPQVRSRALVKGKATADGDPDLIRQVITNLVQNVSRYAPTGSMEILLEEDRGRARLFCSDEGPGIDPSLAEEVFSGENPGGRGLRLGLGLSRDLARMMDGGLWVGAPIRSGATLVLDLPTSSGPESEPAVPTRSEVPTVLPPKGRLLVDIVQLLTGGALGIELTAIGLERLARELLSAETVTLLARRSGTFQAAGRGGQIERVDATEPLFEAIESADGWLRIEAGEWPLFERLTDTSTGYGAAVRIAEGLEGLLLIGWSDPGAVPGARARGILDALRFLAGLALDRSRLADELARERE
ncbi:MAG: ATP-binding protein, partial [Acidimicrobiia bacterium]|nr:ATP-binding protein [Acidimicrobiia bacterium]